MKPTGIQALVFHLGTAFRLLPTTTFSDATESKVNQPATELCHSLHYENS